MPPEPRILDVGCGPGRSALVLASALGGHVTAIDLHQPYLDQLSASARASGLEKRIAPRRLSMKGMKFKAASFDLIWAEGSAYFAGIRKSLASWFPLLKCGGFAAFTELCWLTENRPAEIETYWAPLLSKTESAGV